MSLDKSILHRKEKRKPYLKSKAFDRSCRNHGACGYCRGNKLYQFYKELTRLNGEIREYSR